MFRGSQNKMHKVEAPMLTEQLLKRNLVPDSLIRIGIRKLLRQRLNEITHSDQDQFVQDIAKSPLAVAVAEANEQHYEVPAAFFEKVLGPRLKYSCAWFESATDSLAVAEEKMLALTCARAELADGQYILELGCGWGSLTLWMAEKYPNSKILGVSNSKSQREFILAQAARRGFHNVQIQTQDMNNFDAPGQFDRVVSVEMFEHMRNIPLLFSRIAGWLKDDGKLFVHIFSHRKYSYLFEIRDQSDWMSRYFFSGGMMPSHSLYKTFSEHLQIEQEWDVPGRHYSLTAEHWLKNMDRNGSSIREIFAMTYGKAATSLWWSRWRIFFMACAELWGWNKTPEWQVSHYRFHKANFKK